MKLISSGEGRMVYELSEPVYFDDCISSYIVISTCYVYDDTFVFLSDKDGRILSTELPGSVYGTRDAFEEALAGFMENS